MITRKQQECKRKYYQKHKIKRDAYTKEYRQKHQKEIRVYQEKYRQKNKEILEDYNKKYYQKHKEKYIKYAKSHYHKYTRIHKNNTLIRHYNLSLKEYKKMFKSQRGVCAICKKPETKATNGKTHLLSVDHNHKTGKVRGLLCNHCNVGIGMFETENLLKSAIKYIKEV